MTTCSCVSRGRGRTQARGFERRALNSPRAKDGPRALPPPGCPPQAVVSNLYAILLKLGVVPVGLFQHQGWAQETGWLLSLQDVREPRRRSRGPEAEADGRPYRSPPPLGPFGLDP